MSPKKTKKVKEEKPVAKSDSSQDDSASEQSSSKSLFRAPTARTIPDDLIALGARNSEGRVAEEKTKKPFDIKEFKQKILEQQRKESTPKKLPVEKKPSRYVFHPIAFIIPIEFDVL